MIRVESRPYHQAATALQPNFNRLAVRCPRLRRGCRQFQFHELGRLRLPQPFLPCEDLRSAPRSLAAKRRYTLPAPSLLGNNLPPLPPRLLSALCHATRLLSPAAIRKMRFTYRSHLIVGVRNLLQCGTDV